MNFTRKLYESCATTHAFFRILFLLLISYIIMRSNLVHYVIQCGCRMQSISGASVSHISYWQPVWLHYFCLHSIAQSGRLTRPASSWFWRAAEWQMVCGRSKTTWCARGTEISGVSSFKITVSGVFVGDLCEEWSNTYGEHERKISANAIPTSSSKINIIQWIVMKIRWLFFFFMLFSLLCFVGYSHIYSCKIH